jgi:hypothetical protein
MSNSLKDSKTEKINNIFKSRKEQIDNELNRIKQLLLNESVTEVSLDIHIKFDKTKFNFNHGIWRTLSHLDEFSELKFLDQVKKEVKLKTDEL